MQRSVRMSLGITCVLLLACAGSAPAQDWPQWLGPDRNCTAQITVPQTWPEALTQKWKTSVGDGCSSPLLVGDKLYVFARVNDNEVLQCLDAASGESIWQESYSVSSFGGPDARDFMGPRSTPAVAQGKIVTLGVTGIVTCYNLSDHKQVWQKDDFPGKFPRFHTSASPLILNDLCIVFIGGSEDGALVAYDLDTGERKWAWEQEGPAYGSPSAATIDGVTAIVTLSNSKIVAVNATNGKLLWEAPFETVSRSYNAATPLVYDQTMIYGGAGRGTMAVKFAKDGETLKAESLWSNPDDAVQYNTPILKNDAVFSLSSKDKLVCINAKDGTTAWTQAVDGDSGYGNIIDAGPVLMALTGKAKLIVYEPDAQAYKEIASYTVADSPTYAFPIVSGNRLYVKDADSVTLWTF